MSIRRSAPWATGALAAAAVLVAGCSESHRPASAADHVLNASSAAPSATVVASAPPASARSSCGVYEAGADVRVLTDGGPQECQVLAQGLSSGGSYWSLQPQPATGTLGLVCVMTRDGIDAEVEDSGGQDTAHSVCSSFISAGWVENTAAEQNAANAASSAAAAAAEASASVAADQQAVSDQDKAAGAVTHLGEDTALIAGDLTTMASDAVTTDKDLATTRADAAQGPGDNCSNVADVTYDAASTVTYDAQSTVAYDANSTLTYTFTSIDQDIADLVADLHTLSSEGGAAPDGAAAAIDGAHSTMRGAVATANGYIDRVNADVFAAYRVADTVAVGACSGQGPGTPPAPVAHLK